VTEQHKLKTYMQSQQNIRPAYTLHGCTISQWQNT